jgi:hypothetical protein
MRSARLTLFLAAAAIVSLGLFGTLRLEQDAGMAFLLGALTLGGGFLICALFSLNMPWHGVLGGGVLALLGFGRGLLNTPDFAEFLAGNRERGMAPPMEIAVALVCVLVLLWVYRAWSKERIRRVRGDS